MPIQQPMRGVQQKQEVHARSEWRDIRTWTEKLRAWIESGDPLLLVAAMVLALMWVFPRSIEATFLLGLLFFRWASRQQFALPFRMPASSGRLDHNDPDLRTGGRTSSKAAGIAFLGNERDTMKELWLKGDDMRTHLLVFGSTGAGKALRDDERILTPNGWRRLDTLEEGDALLTPDGRLQRLEGVYPQGELDLWEVVLEDGRRLETCAEHLWEAIDGDGRAELRATQALADGTWKVPLPAALPLPPMAVDPLSTVPALRPRLRTGISLPLAAHGSVEQRRALLGALRSDFPVRQGTGEETWVFSNGASAQWLAELTRSLGALATVAGHGAGWEVRVRWHMEFATVTRAAPLGRRASCRCIEVSDPRGLFVAGDSVATHNTETLVSLAFNALVHGSGFIYVDGKGDNSLFAKIFSMCRSVGREDDLLAINYMTGGRDVFGPQAHKLSNTINPFSTGSAGGLTELLVGLMDEAGGDGALWKGRAVAMLSGIMFALVYMRETEGLLLDVDKLRDYLILENIQKLAARSDLPPAVIRSLRAYLVSLPGYADGPKQSETTMDQHGFLQMQFTRILSSLSDTYGYIFRTNLGEVDFFDVVVNRRILVVLLPALEKSQDELGNLGKIIVACLKQMMATGLGDTLEGDYKTIIETKPTNSPAPYMCILDEYGYYVIRGAAVMPAQARSLGFSMVFAGQDLPSFKKNNNAEEAASTIGNCNIKIFMKLEDPTDTYDLFRQSAGEALVSKTSGYSFETGMVAGSYIDQRNASLERRARGDILDLKDQREGEAHIIFKSALIRARMFFVNPAKVAKIQLNHFLRVEPPHRDDMHAFQARIETFRANLRNPAALDAARQATQPKALIGAAQNALEKALTQGLDARHAMAAAMAAAHDLSYVQMDEMTQSLRDQFARLNASPTQVHVFSTPPPLAPENEDNDLDGDTSQDDDEESEDEEDPNRDADGDGDYSSPVGAGRRHDDDYGLGQGDHRYPSSGYTDPSSSGYSNEWRDRERLSGHGPSDTDGQRQPPAYTSPLPGRTDAGLRGGTDGYGSYGTPSFPYGTDGNDPLSPERPMRDGGMRGARGHRAPSVFLSEDPTVKQLIQMEMDSGATREEAERTAHLLKDDVRRVSSYPDPTHTPQASGADEITKIMQEMDDDLEVRQM